MRDAGLECAIDAAGGVAQLARRIGIAQPSVSNWSRVPAARVLAVEAATGVSRKLLRPDLYGGFSPEDGVIDPIDAARAQEYALLATLLSSSPSRSLLDQLARLGDDGTPLGRAHAVLADAASTTMPADVNREYLDLFVGVGRGELLPYASYYLTGFLNERPLSRLRAALAALGIERSGNNSEPEDHAATLCEIMAGFASGRLPASMDAQRAFFETHVAAWMGRMFADVERAAHARFYRAVGALGRLFLEIESEAFALVN